MGHQNAFEKKKAMNQKRKNNRVPRDSDFLPKTNNNTPCLNS